MTRRENCLRLQKLRVNVTHGLADTPIYKSWQMMIQRCYNKNYPRYKDWGGRGIRVCDEWVALFENFYKDMGERPLGKTLDRIDNNGDYNRSNCRWATREEQSKNKRIRKDSITCQKK